MPTVLAKSIFPAVILQEEYWQEKFSYCRNPQNKKQSLTQAVRYTDILHTGEKTKWKKK